MRTLQAALALCTASAIVALPAAAQDDSSLSRARARGTLRYGGDIQGGEPFSFRDSTTGELRGFEVEIANAVAQKLGLRAEFVQSDWSSLIPLLERGDIDVIFNGIEITDRNVQRVRMTRPYFAFSIQLVVRRAELGRYTSGLAAIRGKRIGSLTNSLAADLIERAHGELVRYEGQEEPYIDLATGRIDGVMLDDIIAERYGLTKPTLALAADVGEGAYAAALRPKDRALAHATDAALAELLADGTIKQIVEGYRLPTTRMGAMQREAPRFGQDKTTGPSFTMGTFLQFLRAARATLVISILAMLLAVTLGMGLAVARLFGPPPVRWLSASFVEVWRGTPVLLQLYVLYYGLSNVIDLNAYAAAVLGLGLNYAAYEAEVYRGGIVAVPPGQMEASRALGMSTWLALRRVIVPQAARISLPGVMNDFNALLKDTSLVSIITVVELTKQMTITAVDLRSWLVPGAMCALLYFAMSFPLARLTSHIERKLAE